LMDLMRDRSRTLALWRRLVAPMLWPRVTTRRFVLHASSETPSTLVVTSSGNCQTVLTHLRSYVPLDTE